MSGHGKKQFTANVYARENAGNWTERYEVIRRGTLELVIDVDKLIETFGRKALGNKTRRARAIAGAISAEVHSVTETRVNT